MREGILSGDIKAILPGLREPTLEEILENDPIAQARLQEMSAEFHREFDERFGHLVRPVSAYAREKSF